MPDDLDALLDAARRIPQTNADAEAQRRSFAYGNANIENEDVTREMVDAAADGISHP